MCNVNWVTQLPNIWCNNAPLPKEKYRAAVEIVCVHKAHELHYNAPHISDVVVGLILNLDFHTEDTDRVGDTVQIFIFPNLSLSKFGGGTNGTEVGHGVGHKYAQHI